MRAGSGLVMTAFSGNFLLYIKSFLLCNLSPGQGNISRKAVTPVNRSDEMNCPISLIVLCCYFNKTWDNCHWNRCCTGGRFVIFFPVSHPDRWRGMRPCKQSALPTSWPFPLPLPLPFSLPFAFTFTFVSSFSSSSFFFFSFFLSFSLSIFFVFSSISVSFLSVKQF